MNCKCLLITILSVTSFFEVFSQETKRDTLEVNELEPVLLTATRTPRQLSSLPLPVTLVSKGLIEQSGSVRLDEILNEQTGIITVSDESGFEGVQIQGMSSNYVLILIDGVPMVGRSAGNFDLSRLTVGNIKQIEVVKGPSSSLYGSEALGGVINIITEKPSSEHLSGNVSYRYGRFSQQDINLELKQQRSKFRYSLFANRFSSDGYDLDPNTAGQTVNPFENYTLNGKFYYDLNDNLSLFTSARYYDQDQVAGFTADETVFEGNSVQREWNLHFKVNHNWKAPLKTEYELYYTNYRAEEMVFDSLTEEILTDSNFDQRLFRPEIRGTYAFKNRSKLTGGIGFQYDELDRTFFDDKVNFTSQYLYAQYDVTPLENLNIIAGIRFDNHSEYSNQLSPKLALRKQLSESFAIKASAGYGFKAPDFRQLYFDFTNSAVGYTVLGYNVALEKLEELESHGQILDVLVSNQELNEPLKAEQSIGYNFGFQFDKKRWNVETNFFRNDFSNLIDTRIIARKTNGQNVFSYVNFSEIYTTGAELNTSYTVNDDLSISGGYQLLFAYDKEKEEQVNDGGVFVRDPNTNQAVALKRSDYFGLINRSRHNANLKVFYKLSSWNTDINLRLLYRSKYALFDTNGNDLIDRFDTSFVDGFLTANIATSKELYEDFTLQVGANNLLDYTDNNIPTLPGIQWYAKLNYQF